MKRIAIYAAMLVIFAAHGPAAAKASAGRVHPDFFGVGTARCPWQTLNSKNFDGPMEDDTYITFIGSLVSGKSKYSIYFHDHRDRHGAMHEVSRILLFAEKCRYLGQYVVMNKPSHIRGEDILFDIPNKYGNMIRFSNGQPPAQVVIDGEVEAFWPH